MNILIVGAGVAGLTLAYWLERQGQQPVIIERALHLRDDGFMIDFFGPGYAVAERMNLLPDLAAIYYPIERLAFVDAAGHERFSIAADSFRALLNNRWLNIMHGDLVRVLYEAIKAQVPVRFGTSVAALEQDATQVHVTLTDGTSSTFDLVVGADGVHSRVRQLAFGSEDQFSRFLGYYTAAFVTEDVPVGPGALYTLAVPGRQINVYPIGGDRFATLFAHQAHSQLDTCSPEVVERKLKAAYGRLGWIVPELLDRSRQAESMYFDAVTQIVMSPWSKGRVVLVGDACQCVSLIVGQGASQAMASAYMLAHELVASPNAQVTEALARYEQHVKPGIVRTQLSGRRQARWFVPDSRMRISMRDLFLRMMAWQVAAPLLKRGLALSDGFKL